MLDLKKLRSQFTKVLNETTAADFDKWMGDKNKQDMIELIPDIIKVLKAGRYDLSKESITQLQIQQHLILHCRGPYPLIFIPEYPLDEKNRPDFFEFTYGIAIEVKIKGSKIAIFKQCERYCKFESVKALILCTNKAMGFPPEINGKPCYYINIGKAWL